MKKRRCISKLMCVVILKNKRMALCDDRCVHTHTNTYRRTCGEGVYWVYAVGDVLLFLSLFAIEMYACAHLHATIPSLSTHTP